MNISILGLPAHNMVFIFFTFLRGVFKSSVFNSLKNAIFIFKNQTKPDIWVHHIFILQCRLEQIFIFVFTLKPQSSNLPENPQGAPTLTRHYFWVWLQQCMCASSHLVFFDKILLEEKWKVDVARNFKKMSADITKE